MDDFNSLEMLKASCKIGQRDYSAAFEMLVPLAEAGNPKAQCNLAFLYSVGLGAPHDGEKAVELYLKVAEQNIAEEHLSALSYHNMATIYNVGAPGVEPDPEMAQKYEQLARDLGFEM